MALRWLAGLIGLCLGWLAFPDGGMRAAAETPGDSVAIAWPEPTQSARPWTRWWWHGSAVDRENLARLLELYQAAGLGGVEITCIYGVQDNETRNRDYLSDAWLAAVRHAITEAERLGLGVDLPAGSGWRMGGPSVTPELANSHARVEDLDVAGGETFRYDFGEATPLAVRAFSDAGEQVDLAAQLAEGRVRWTAPAGQWTVYTLGSRWAGDRVKRAGPGGGGLNINPYSGQSVQAFLNRFGQSLDRLPAVRAQFHDSFEYEGNWQPAFLDEFFARRGYRLEDHLPQLAGRGDLDLVARVKCDCRETLSDLVRDEFVGVWVNWAHRHDQLARNQSHGSPANWLDLYALCDIPETESFGRLHGGHGKRLIFKFASSAAHLTGKPLVAAETATWLGEHFTVTLADVKEIVDRQMLAGVNHVVFHGTAYSPADADWPGWLFYASTQLNPQNPIWRDLPALNAYITRCQSVLQEAKPDNDVLLYWPLHDVWHDPQGLRMQFAVGNADSWFTGRPIETVARLLDQGGYGFDFVSDRGLSQCSSSEDGGIAAPGGRYRAIVVPHAEHMPLPTLARLHALADAGGTILFWKSLPASPPGLAGVSEHERWNELRAALVNQTRAPRVADAVALFARLVDAGAQPETDFTTHDIAVRRTSWGGWPCYLLKNQSTQPLDFWATPAKPFSAAALLDPLDGTIGSAQLRDNAIGTTQLRLQLAPGQSLLCVLAARPLANPPWAYRAAAGPPVEAASPWHVDFLAGGPALPAPFVIDRPEPWTERADSATQCFAGTARYATTIATPANSQRRWRLDLGDVRSSARVVLDGQLQTTLIAPPFATLLDLTPGQEHRLEVEVTSVAANRIRELDRRGVAWRRFEDINFVNIDYKPFDASGWDVAPLGLVGPVTLAPLSSQ